MKRISQYLVALFLMLGLVFVSGLSGPKIIGAVVADDSTSTSTTEESTDVKSLTTDLTESATGVANSQTSKPKDLTLILDFSGSMSSKISGEAKETMLKNALKSTLTDIPDGTYVTVWAYGQTYSSQDKEKSCTDAEEVYVYDKVDANKISKVVDKMSPNGFSPVAYSLEQALKGLESQATRDHVVVLLSDGEEACDGDPSLAVKNQVDKGMSLEVNTIGLDVDTKAKAELEAVALAGDGEYYAVKSSDDLKKSLSTVFKTLDSGTTQASGEAIKVTGGSSFEEAKAFNTDYNGKELTPKEHMKADEKEYWKLTLTPGQAARITVMTGTKDVQYSDSGEAKETDDAPSAGVAVYDSNENELFDVSVQQTKNSQKSGEIWEVPAEKDTYTFYLGVGYWLPIHKDMTYKVEILDQYDSAVGKGDAPGEIKARLTEIEAGTYTGYLSGSDKADYYRMSLYEGQNLTVTLEPEATEESDFSLELYDSNRDLVVTEETTGGKTKITLEQTVTADDEYTLGVLQGFGKYNLEVQIEGEKKVEDAVVAPVTNETEDLIVTEEPKNLFEQWFGDSAMLVMIGGGAALVFILIVVILVIVMIKKRKKKKTSKGGIMTTPPSSGQQRMTEVKPTLGKDMPPRPQVRPRPQQSMDNKPSEPMMPSRPEKPTPSPTPAPPAAEAPMPKDDKSSGSGIEFGPPKPPEIK